VSDAVAHDVAGSEVGAASSVSSRGNTAREWITRKETRLCHPLRASLVFHLKRFEYASDGVEKLGGTVDVPAELDVGPCCLADDSGDESQRGKSGVVAGTASPGR